MAAQDTTTTMPPALAVCPCSAEYATFLALINVSLFMLPPSRFLVCLSALSSSPSYIVVSVFRDRRAFMPRVVSVLVKRLMSVSIVVHGPPWAEITGSIYSFAGSDSQLRDRYQQVLHMPFFFSRFLNIICGPLF